MFPVLIIMISGIILGYFISDKRKLLTINDKLVTVFIYVLLFLLGVEVGLNEKIINNFYMIGYQSIVITFGALLGSLLCSYVVYKLFFSTKR